MGGWTRSDAPQLNLSSNDHKTLKDLFDEVGSEDFKGTLIQISYSMIYIIVDFSTNKPKNTFACPELESIFCKQVQESGKFSKKTYTFAPNQRIYNPNPGKRPGYK